MIMYTNHHRHKFTKWKKSNQKYLQSFNVRVSPPCTFCVIICLSVACVASGYVGDGDESRNEQEALPLICALTNKTTTYKGYFSAFHEVEISCTLS